MRPPEKLTPAPPVGRAAFFGDTARRPLVVAHRGGSLEAPENTLEALHRGVAVGSDWQEVDVALTADGVPVILHDDTLERTTGTLGEIARWQLEDALRLPVGNPRWDEAVRARLMLLGIEMLPQFAGAYVGARLPSLRQVLAVPGARLMLELKATSRPRQMAEAVLDAVQDAGAAGRVAIASFDGEVLDEVAQRAPALPLVGLAETMPQARDMLGRKLAVLGVHTDLVAEAWAATPPHVAVWAWTVYTVKMALQAVAAGADGVIADNPAAVMLALRNHSPSNQAEVPFGQA